MSDLNIFLKDLEELKKFPLRTIKTAQRNAILNLHNELISKPPTGTPVDTGRARGSWGIEEGAPGTFQLEEAPEGTQGEFFKRDAAKAEQQKVKGDAVKAGSTWYVYNNMPYIKALNDGSSKQSPENFVEDAVKITEIRMQDYLDGAKDKDKGDE